MSKRLRREALIACAILLGSCRQGTAAGDTAMDMAESAYTDARSALSQNENQEHRINTLERELKEQEQINDAIAADLRALQRQIEANRPTPRAPSPLGL